MSYTLKYTGAEIDDILDRAVEGGAIDEALALKAPLESPALTGTPTAPTPAESDNSTKVATTAYADRAAAGAAAAAYPVDSASGVVASFPDGADGIPMKSFACSIEPIQNLNGQSAPYPAGGGKNKMDDTVTDGHTAEVTLPAGTYYAQAFYTAASSNYNTRLSYLNGGTWTAIGSVPYSQDGVSLTGFAFGHAGSAGLARGYDTATLTLTNTTTIRFGFSDTAKATRRLSISSEELTAYAPYSNVCPISGHSGVNAVVAGKNLWSLGNISQRYGSNVPYILGAGSYVVSFTSPSANKKLSMRFNHADGTSTAKTESVSTFTLTQPCVSINWAMTNWESGDVFTNIQIESGSSPTEYEPYIGTTYPVTFYDGDDPLTVYKGSVDLVSGVLTVTQKGVNMGGLNWIDNGGIFYAALSDMKTRNVRRMEMLCSVYQVISDGRALADVPDYSCYNGTQGSNNVVFVHDSRYNGNVAGLKSSLNGQTLVYDLATQLVYNLTPTEVLSLLGQNNCWNDCSDTAVEYRADIALYVQKYLGGNVSTLSMSAPTPSLSLGRTGVLLEPEALEPVITEDAEPDLAEEEPEAEEE